MDILSVVAKVVAKNEFIEIVKSELLKLVAPTRQEADVSTITCIRISQIHQYLFSTRTGKNSSSLEKHKNSDHYKACIIAVDGMIEDKSVHKITMVAVA